MSKVPDKLGKSQRITLVTTTDTGPTDTGAMQLLVAHCLEKGAWHHLPYACIGNLGAVYALGRAGVISGQLKDGVETSLLGYRAICPSGGGYVYDAATDTASSDIYGSMTSLKRRDDLTPDSQAAHMVDSVQRLVSRLAFTEQGLAALVKIERK